MNSSTRWILLTLSLSFLIFVVFVQFFSPSSSPGQWSYTDLVTHAQAGQVKSISISGTTGLATDTAGATFRVSLPSDQTVTLADNLKAEGVNVPSSPPTSPAPSFSFCPTWSSSFSSSASFIGGTVRPSVARAKSCPLAAPSHASVPNILPSPSPMSPASMKPRPNSKKWSSS
jgi:hypothetical protein